MNRHTDDQEDKQGETIADEQTAAETFEVLRGDARSNIYKQLCTHAQVHSAIAAQESVAVRVNMFLQMLSTKRVAGTGYGA